jgi:aspartyl-tRNA(Asn)/glutamyl-tRNA(Gln) amidotransferase subunit A
MTEEDLAYTPATELAGLIRDKQLSPVELVGTILKRIERHNGKINAFAHLAADQAMDDARRAEAAVMAGAPLGPLHGVPVTIKDLSITKRMPSQFGSRILEGN